MKKCAFISLDNVEGWVIDDDLVHAPLKQLGWQVDNVPWRDQAVNWNDYHVAVIRSPWDYQQDPEAFMQVLETIEKSSCKLYNGLDIVRWNLDKNYLFELGERGVELVPTLKGEYLTKADLINFFEQLQTNHLVIKPMVGANADDTFSLHKETLDDSLITEVVGLFQGREFMAQPFMSGIVEEGEFSVIYYGDKRSHVILKVPGKGDFRVQEEHGGSVVPIAEPEAALILACDRALHVLPEIPLYSRLDFVRTAQNTFALMELELIEPCLYFRFGENAAGRFAEHLEATYAAEVAI